MRITTHTTYTHTIHRWIAASRERRPSATDEAEHWPSWRCSQQQIPAAHSSSRPTSLVKEQRTAALIHELAPCMMMMRQTSNIMRF